MKKVICYLLLFSLIITLVSCNDSKSEISSELSVNESKEDTPKETIYKIGETVSTDIVKFTLDDAAFSVALNNVVDEDYLSPKEYNPEKDKSNPYVASIGHTFAWFEYRIENINRANIDIEYGLLSEVKYKGKNIQDKKRQFIIIIHKSI